jgi:hypothetical protein
MKKIEILKNLLMTNSYSRKLKKLKDLKLIITSSKNNIISCPETSSIFKMNIVNICNIYISKMRSKKMRFNKYHLDK